MLKNVSIQQFRLFEKLSINNLARVNLIVGKNNTGKSSLLEALYLLVSQNSPETLLTLLETRGEISFQAEALRSRGYDISHLFCGHQLEDGASILIQSEEIEPLGLQITFFRNIDHLSPSSKEEHNRLKSPVFLRLEYSATERKIDLDLFGGLLDGRHLMKYTNFSLDQLNSNYITTKGFNYDLLAKLWDTLTLTPKEDDVIKMLQILEPSVERISFQSSKTANSGILIKQKGHNKPFPLGSMGEGMHRILAIASALANSENGYLFVDEIDTGLHYRTITDMWNLVFKTAERLNIQVFATTHSSDCIESFDEALNMQGNPDMGNLFRLERRGEQVVAIQYNSEDLTTATRQEIEVR